MKSIFLSKTFWGAVLAVVAGVLGIFGYDFGTDAQADVLESVYAGVAAVGGIIAVIGRIKASKSVSVLPSKE